ncbi:MAG: hypothetical protein HWN66_18040, partial [Candidatus Helarchaeota archaeon]|nr:hypothetical protein [Candidatus Helarchaeota archaeon]
MKDKIEKLIQLAEKAKEAGHYALALKYLNIAIELAEQANDQQAIMKCLSLINSITKYLGERKQKLSKKTKYSLEKQLETSQLYSLLTGTKPRRVKKEDKTKLTSEFERTVERVEKTEKPRAGLPKELLLKEISDELKGLQNALYAVRPSIPAVSVGKKVPAKAKEKKKAGKKREEFKEAPALAMPEEKFEAIRKPAAAPLGPPAGLPKDLPAGGVGGGPPPKVPGPPGAPPKKPLMGPPSAPSGAPPPPGGPPKRPSMQPVAPGGAAPPP